MSSNFKPQELSYFFRSFGFAKPFWKLFVLTFVLNTLFSATSALTVAVIKPIFELVFTSNIAQEVLIDRNFLSSIKTQFYSYLKNLVVNPIDVYSTLVNLSLLIIILFLVKNFFKYLGSISNARLEENIIKNIRNRIYSKILKLDLSFFNAKQAGNIISVLTNDVNVVNSTSISALTGLLREIIQVVIYIFLLLAISPLLTFIALTSGVGTVGILRYSTDYLRKYANRMQGAMADFTSVLQETLSGMRIVKGFNLENTFFKKFAQQTHKYFRSSIKFQSIISLVPSLNEIFAIFALVVVFLIGGNYVLKGIMRADDLMLFLFALFSIMSPIATIVHNISQFQRGYVSSKRVFEILDADIKILSGTRLVKSFENRIDFKNVSFAYSEQIVLSNVSFVVSKGKKIALVGSSGSGKSTIIDLLVRFYDPTDGEILFDGINIKDFDIQSYRNLFGIVSQEIILFNDTIENNIKISRPEATRDDVIYSARLANALPFIEKLPNGFDTVIGERGVLLSGGERQRIAIARALLSNPSILIFDEATSALDSESEKVVQEAISLSLHNRTAIIVAHRLATIIDCDEILVFDSGRIVEQGTHSKLFALNGIYRKLYNLQTKSEDS